MRIELGKTYLTRDGKTVTITYREPKDYTGAYPYRGDNGTWYTVNGHYWDRRRTHPDDLVEEVQASAPAVTESICDADQQQVRNTIIRRADEARITGFATAALSGVFATPNADRWNDAEKVWRAWAIADAMEAEWQKRFGR